MVFVSNTIVDSVSKGNDIYEATFDGSAWHPKRIDELCSDFGTILRPFLPMDRQCILLLTVAIGAGVIPIFMFQRNVEVGGVRQSCLQG